MYKLFIYLSFIYNNLSFIYKLFIYSPVQFNLCIVNVQNQVYTSSRH